MPPQGARIDLGVEAAQNESGGPNTTPHSNQDYTTGGNLAILPTNYFPSVVPRKHSQGSGFGPEGEQTSSVINRPIKGGENKTKDE